MRVFGISITELAAGLLVVAIGLFVLLTSANLAVGTARAMGPGFVPVSMGVILILLGFGIVLIEGRRSTDALPSIPAVRPLIFIPAAIIAFALTVQRFGLIPSVFVAALISTLADPASKLATSVLIAASVAILSYLVFGYGLGLQVRAWSW